jgi:hypothetical protein
MARLLVALVALGLLVSGCTSVSSNADPGVPRAAFRCPDPSVRDPGDHSAGVLPHGATAALICSRDTDSPWIAPREPLTRDVAGLVDLVNAQHPRTAAEGDVCNAAGGPAWSILLLYPTGVRTIEGDNGGCETMMVGTQERHGAARIFWAFAHALLAQRSHGTPPRSVRTTHLSCPGREPLPSPTARADLLVSGDWCVRRGDRFRADGKLTPRQLAVLRHDLATAGPRSGSRLPRLGDCQGLRRSTRALIHGTDAWGDPVQISIVCDVLIAVDPRTRATDYVRMLPATAAMLARVVT